MSDLKTDMLRVIKMAEEFAGRLPPQDREEAMGWLTRVKARVQGGPTHAEIERQNRVLKNALERVGGEVNMLIGKAIRELEEKT
jgi:hypothetical protein